MNDLSWVEIASMKELSGLVLQPWEWKMHGAPQGGRAEEEGTEGSLTDNETDDGPNGWESPTDSGDSCATSRVSTSKEEQGTDRWEVGSKSSCEVEITKEPMDEEETELVGSAMTDTTLGSVVPSSQEAGWLEDPLDLGHLAGGDGKAELASVKCGGLDTPMVGGDASSVAHKEQRKASWNPLPLNHPP